ncbi:MAG: RNA polymerase sigma factor [Steroidobacteraceae bacterium]
MGRAEDGFFLQALEYEGILRAFLQRYAPDPADVEELLQETYARLLSEAESSKPKTESVRGCALRLARDTVLEWLCRSGVVSLAPIAEIDALAVLDECTQVESIVGAQEELARLSEAVASLPERCRQAYTLRKVYGFTQSEIAARLRISEETVQDYLALAARRCAHALFDRPPAATPRRVAFLSRIRRRVKPQ